MGHPRLSAEMEEGARAQELVDQGEGGEKEGKGVCVWVCSSHRDRDGDECLSAFG